MRLMVPERPRIESLVYRLLDDGSEVADVLQDVYLAAYRGLPKYRGDGQLSTWLYRITYNACLKHRAKRPAIVESESSAREPALDHAGLVSERLDLASALARLPVEQRALVLMVDRDGFDYRAAAEALSIPLGTVSSRMAAARDKLRRALTSEGASHET
jgi:RNA polymerase sigma-70 factor (ECF subfamily)